MATKLETPILRRVPHSSRVYEILELEITAETLTLSGRNPRQEPRIVSLPLADALARLFPDHYGVEPETTDWKGLEDTIMVDAGLTQDERAKFFNLVRRAQEGE
jgi:hypothetical protein